ncbi:hypothetical protein KC354_g59 [Hortaea werneckii]|nr:hypothetical protein KC354_g59 [Hortaea werneckii]
MVLEIVHDDALVVVEDGDAKSSADPAFPEDAVDPGEADLLALDVVHVDADGLGGAQAALVVAVLGLLDPQLFRVAEAAFLISRLSLTNSSGRSRERMARTTRRPDDMISFAFDEVSSGTMGSQTSRVVGRFAIAGDEETGPGGDFEAVAEEGIVGFDESRVADQRHDETL